MTREMGEQGAIERHDIDRFRARDERADHRRSGSFVQPEHGKRICVASLDDRIDRA